MCRLRNLLALALLLWGAPASAQVAFDTTNATGVFAQTSSLVTSFNISTTMTTGGTNRVGLLGCAVGSMADVTTATWNGSSMTELVRRANGTDGRGAILYWIAAPPTTSSTVTVNASGGGSSFVCGAWAFTGAHQTVQTGNVNGNDFTTTPTTQTCTLDSNGMIADFVYALNAGAVPTANGGTKINHLDQGAWYGAGSYNGTNGTMGWNITGITRASEVCASIQPAAGGGGGGPASRMTLTGVGR